MSGNNSDRLHTIKFSDLRAVNTIESINQLSSTPTEAVEAIQVLVARRTQANRLPNTDDDVISALIQALSYPHPLVSAAAVEGLVKLAPNTVEPLITACQAATDQGVQASIIQALARIGDQRALERLAEVVGTAIANHCQGNVRRVAARGLGRIGSLSNDPQIIRHAVDKLAWALFKPEDWALRYAAVVSLQEIATSQSVGDSVITVIIPILQQALTQERERVVQVRIETALKAAR